MQEPMSHRMLDVKYCSCTGVIRSFNAKPDSSIILFSFHFHYCSNKLLTRGFNKTISVLFCFVCVCVCVFNDCFWLLGYESTDALFANITMCNDNIDIYEVDAIVK